MRIAEYGIRSTNSAAWDATMEQYHQDAGMWNATANKETEAYAK